MRRILLLFSLFVTNILLAQSDGTLDESFGTNGMVFLNFTQLTYSENELRSLAVLDNGKTLVSGVIHHHGSDQKYFIGRYNLDGSLDTDFGIDGLATGDLNYQNEILVQPDGKILFRGTDFDNPDHLVRYTSDGVLDQSFGQNGVLEILNYNIYAFCILSDGKILTAEYPDYGFENGVYRMARYSYNGVLDQSFGTNGYVNIVIPNFFNQYQYPPSYFLKVQTDGKILLTSSVGAESNSDIAIVRYESNGQLDTGFGTGGIKIIDLKKVESLNAITIQKDGKILLTDTAYEMVDNGYVNYQYLIRLIPNGNLDVDFGNNGIVILSLTPTSLAVQSDDKIIVGGVIDSGIDSSPVAAATYRLNTNGSVDLTYGNAGLVTTTIQNSRISRANVALQSQGEIVIGVTGCEAYLSCHPKAALMRYENSFLDELDISFQKNNLSVYPNPVNEFVNLDFTLDRPQIISVDLYDVFGNNLANLLKATDFQFGYNSQKLYLPGTLSSGIYFLNISNGKSASVVKLIK